MTVFDWTAGVLSLIPLALFFHWLKVLLYAPSETRQRQRDFDPDTISGWNLRGPR